MKTVLLCLAVASALLAQTNTQNLLLGLSDAPSTPVDSPGAGTYSSTQSVTLTDATAQFILYTVSGSAPACPATGTLYSGAFNISTTSTLKAIGCNGITGGGVLTSVYTISAFSGAYRNSATVAPGAAPLSISYTVVATTDVLIVCEEVNGTGAGAVPSFSSAVVSTWHSIAVTDNGASKVLGCSWGIPTTTGASTFTCSNSNLDVSYCGLSAFTGLTQASPIDTNPTGTNGTGTAISTGAFTTSTTDVIYAAAFGNDGSIVIGSGFTGPIAFGLSRFLGEYIPSAAAGSITATASQTNSSTWLIVGMGLH